MSKIHQKTAPHDTFRSALKLRRVPQSIRSGSVPSAFSNSVKRQLETVVFQQPPFGVHWQLVSSSRLFIFPDLDVSPSEPIVTVPEPLEFRLVSACSAVQDFIFGARGDSSLAHGIQDSF